MGDYIGETEQTCRCTVQGLGFRVSAFHLFTVCGHAWSVQQGLES